MTNRYIEKIAAEKRFTTSLKNRMERYPKTKEQTNPARIGTRFDCKIMTMPSVLRITDPAIAGRAIKNDISSASSFLSPQTRPPVIVVPERESPGRMAVI